MNFKKTIIFLFCLFLSLKTYSKDKVTLEDKKSFSSIKLVSPYQVISNQTKKIPIGLWITLDKGWHSYWKNPGESGKPLAIKWNLPKGASMSPLMWPLPEKITFGSLTNFGYKNSFLLTSELFLPKKPTKPINITAEVEWLICKKVCIPITSKIQIEWPIENIEKMNIWKDTFQQWSKRMPKIMDKKITLKSKDTQWQAHINTKKKLQLIDVFPLSKSTFSFQPPIILSKKAHQHSILINPLLSSQSSNTNQDKFSFTKSTPSSSYTSFNKSKVLVVFQDMGNRLGFIYTFQKEKNTLWFLLLAFLGGIFLNLMPCVLPIVFLKFSNTIEQSKQKTSSVILSNLFYSAGVICSFLLLALILLLLKRGGESVGWGFQMQSPYFLLSIIFLFIFISFNFMGWLSFSVPSFPFLHKGQNFFKHFLTGSLSTTAASPCTAPFMGAAMGYAFSESTTQIIMIFLFLGLGLSFPYLLLSIFPKWIQYIPFPGKWSNKLKHFMAFPMLATCAWLIHLFNQQESTNILPLFFSLICIYFGFWLLNNFKRRTWLTWCSRIIILIAVIYPFIHFYQTTKSDSPKIVWEPFSIEKMQTLHSEGKTIFVNFTADWCLTCKFNEQITFKNQRVIHAFTERKIHGLKGDWTNKNPEITSVLERYRRSGIPFYLYFSPDSPSAIVLPELLTPNILLKHIDRE